MDYLQVIQNKIIDKDALSKLVANYQLKNQKIVFTNGCFDLLHQGHVTYLAQAASLGNRLIVGINSDNSVQKLKGIHNINSQQGQTIVDLKQKKFSLNNFKNQWQRKWRKISG